MPDHTDVQISLQAISKLSLERGLTSKRDLAKALDVSPTMLGAFLNSRDPLKRNARLLSMVLQRDPSELLEPIDKFKLQEWMARRRIPTEKALAHEMGISPSSLSMMFELPEGGEKNQKRFDPVKQIAYQTANFFEVQLDELLVYPEEVPEEFEAMLRY